MSKFTCALLLVSVQALAGCDTEGRSSRSLFGPSTVAPPIGQPVGATLKMFTEPGTASGSGFSKAMTAVAIDGDTRFDVQLVRP
jgi:hypothetical protein